METNRCSIYQNLQEYLSSVVYSDVISGNLISVACIGKSIIVNSDAIGFNDLDWNEEDEVIAIRVNAKSFNGSYIINADIQ